MRHAWSSLGLALLLIVGFVLLAGYRHPPTVEPGLFGFDPESIRQTHLDFDCRHDGDNAFHTHLRVDARPDGGGTGQIQTSSATSEPGDSRIALTPQTLTLTVRGSRETSERRSSPIDLTPQAFNAIVRDMVNAGVASIQTGPPSIGDGYQFSIVFSQGLRVRRAAFRGFMVNIEPKKDAEIMNFQLRTDNPVNLRVVQVLQRYFKVPFPESAE